MARARWERHTQPGDDFGIGTSMTSWRLRGTNLWIFNMSGQSVLYSGSMTPAVQVHEAEGVEDLNSVRLDEFFTVREAKQWAEEYASTRDTRKAEYEALRDRCVRAVEEMGGGVTAEQLAAYTGMSLQEAQRGLHALRRMEAL